jgi:hypothetical protein
LFVIIKERRPRELPMEEDVVVQVHVQEHGANIEDQVNDPMEEDDDANNIVEEDGTNILIQETFNNVGMDDDDDQLDGVFDIPVLEKESQPLYEGSKTSLLSAILLLVNLKVMNGFSNTCVTQLLRYVIYFVTLST